MAYASIADWIVRCDSRLLGDLVSDTGLRKTEAELAAHATLTACLDDASGEIEAALLAGERYTVADLAALTGNSLAYLKRITCTIALALLMERRQWADEDQREEAIDKGRKIIDRLRRGEWVFNVDAVKDAGLPTQHTPNITTIRQLNMTVDEARKGFYPARRLPIN